VIASPGPFEFATATKIVFGRGRVAELASHVERLGSRALIVTGSCPDRHVAQTRQLEDAGIAVRVFPVAREPSVETIRHGVAVAREFDANVVVGLGGGSALDAGKAIAVLITNPGEPLDYLEVIGKGRSLEHPSAPYVAVPTTSGTGAEVTKNAVLESAEHGVKVSLRDDSMLPRVALVDPELTVGVPPEVTATTGLDALTQVIEPLLSCKSNPLVDAIAMAGVRHAREGLRRAFADGRDLAAREHLSLTSLFGGLSLANAKLGVVHGIAGPLGGMTGAAHGALCARLLPAALRATQRALLTRAPAHPALGRLREIAVVLTGDPDASGDMAMNWLERLVDDLNIPRLAQLGLERSRIAELVSKAQRASSMKGSPLPLLDDEVATIVQNCL
jgi:alcohol dehydrogenase class IV